jgi:L-fuconolactonase
MDNKISRRRFLGTAALAVAALPGALGRALAADAPASAATATDAIPIIDTHIHLFDPTRPQGVPWPGRNNTILYRPALPARYRDVTKGLGITGAIEVECSTWLEDNQWVLDVADKDTIMVGTVGNLEPGKPEFPRQLERFHKNPLFRGIRYGNLWGRNLGAELEKPQFIADLKMLADAGLELDTANPNPRLLADVVRLTDLVPSLRVVVDHLPSLPRPQDPDARATCDASLKELGQRPQVYVKVSEVLRRSDGKIAYDLGAYRAKLDEIYDTFGPDRLLYGSDWPNSDPFGTYGQVLSIVREYFTAKGREVAEKYFWKNSIAAYRWVRREAGQPQLA